MSEDRLASQSTVSSAVIDLAATPQSSTDPPSPTGRWKTGGWLVEEGSAGDWSRKGQEAGPMASRVGAEAE